MKSIDYSVYLVTSEKEDEEFLKIIKESLEGGVDLIQIREKTASSKDFYEIALKVKPLTSSYNVPLIINDRVDVALAIDADGVHIGQNDLPCDVVRKIIGPDKLLGVSAGTVEEAIKAEKDGADYIGSGAVFKTSTKDDVALISKEELKEITDSVKIPVVCIGGITLENVKELKNTGIKGISVVSAIMDDENPKIATINLKKEFEKI